MAIAPFPSLPPRDPRGHKGTFGTVVIVGGCASASTRMIGAPALTARAALRAGCGLAKIAAPAPILDAVLSLVPSATGAELEVDGDHVVIPHRAAEVLDRLFHTCDCVVVGPGLGWSSRVTTVDDPRSVASRALVQRAMQQDGVPVVLDADGLNALSDGPEFWRDIKPPTVLTPHPGEFARLVAPLGITVPRTDAERAGAAERLAQKLGCVVVLKGAGTVVTDGLTTWTCRHGHACLATAGTGDVLAGLLAGLISQHFRGESAARLSLLECAQIAVQAHAIAGERWAAAGASAGLVAAELADLLPAVLASLE